MVELYDANGGKERDHQVVGQRGAIPYFSIVTRLA